MKKTIALILILFVSQISIAQLDTKTKNKVRAKFEVAKQTYNNSDYSNTLDKIEEIETLLNGNSLPSLLNLKIKALVGNKQFIVAEKELEKLYEYELTSDIAKDIATYEPIIQSNIKAQKERLERERKAEIERREKEKERERIKEESTNIINIRKDDYNKRLNDINHKIVWYSMDEAISLSENSDKKLLIYFYTNWCGFCKKMYENFDNKYVSAYIMSNYIPVKLNAEGNYKLNFKGNNYENPEFDPNSTTRNSKHSFSKFLGVSAYPTISFFDNEQNLIYNTKGYQTVTDLEKYLKLFSTDEYKLMKTQDDFKNYWDNFKNKFE